MEALLVKVQNKETQKFNVVAYRSQDNTIGIVTVYGLDVQTGSGTSSYLMGTRGFLPGVKQPVNEADHSPSSSAEVKNGGAIPPLTQQCIIN
jgi:hypothetical protein